LTTEREAFEQVLDALLDMFAHTKCGLKSLVTQHASEIGLEPLGVQDAWEGPAKAPTLEFTPRGEARIPWNEVARKLLTIGQPTGLYLIPCERLLGIRGKKGDITVRISDIGQRRLEGVLQYLKDNPCDD
jgi:hypothetical protein